MLSTVLSVISVVFTLNVVLAAIVVFFERRSPSSTWAWLFVLFFIPIIGFIIYLIFGRYTGKKKAFGPKIIRDMETLDGFVRNRDEIREEVEEQYFSNDGIRLGRTYRHLLDFAALNLKSGGWLTYRNKMEYFTDGTKKFESLINDIRNAEKFIHMGVLYFKR